MEFVDTEPAINPENRCPKCRMSTKRGFLKLLGILCKSIPPPQDTHGQGRLCWLMRGGQSPTPRARVSPETCARSLWVSNALYQPASLHVFELTNRVKASFTPVRN